MARACLSHLLFYHRTDNPVFCLYSSNPECYAEEQQLLQTELYHCLGARVWLETHGHLPLEDDGLQLVCCPSGFTCAMLFMKLHRGSIGPAPCPSKWLGLMYEAISARCCEFSDWLGFPLSREQWRLRRAPKRIKQAVVTLTMIRTLVLESPISALPNELLFLIFEMINPYSEVVTEFKRIVEDLEEAPDAKPLSIDCRRRGTLWASAAGNTVVTEDMLALYYPRTALERDVCEIASSYAPQIGSE